MKRDIYAFGFMLTLAIGLIAVSYYAGGGRSAINVPSNNEVMNGEFESVGPTTAVSPPPNPPPEPYVPKDGMLKPLLPLNKQANYAIDITTSGFGPPTLRVKVGQSVVWTNRDLSDHQLAADEANPYPEQGECGSKLNSCVPLVVGESFRVTFAKVGEWKYFDKLNPKFAGKIIVE